MTGFYTPNLHSFLSKKLFPVFLLFAFAAFPLNSNSQDLIISGGFDGPFSNPRAIEFYVKNDISDLSLYGFGIAQNGGGTDGIEYTFPADAVTAGDCITVANDSTAFNNYFGVNATYIFADVNFNGDDAVELFSKGSVIDVFGDINLDGSGEPWEYTDGWFYRKNTTGPDGTTFILDNWWYSGINVNDDQTDNASSLVPFPGCSYAEVTNGQPVFTLGLSLIPEVDESAGMLDVTVNISAFFAGTVDLVMDMGSTASNGPDFTFTNPTTVTFDGSSLTQTVSIPIIDDMDNEPDETIVLELMNPSGLMTIGPLNKLSATILDDDPPSGPANLIISGVFDGPLPGGTPKAVEFYATGDIPDLSQYGFGSANNGDGSDGEEFTFPPVAVDSATCIYVTGTVSGGSGLVQFMTFFGFAADYENAAANINGDDAIELFYGGNEIDIYGNIFVDGNGEPWEYLDGWAYRKNGTGPDGTTFVLENWIYSGPNALDGETMNSTAAVPYPACTYSPIAPADPEFSFAFPSGSVDEGDGSVDVTVGVSETTDCTVEVAIAFSSTAIEGTDYTFSSPTTLTFTNGGPTSMTISIPITDDSDVEGDESIILILQNPTGAGGCVIGTPDETTITIVDNDVAVVNIVDVHGEEADGSATSAGDLVQITGVVHCIDFDGNEGYSFYITDATGGINVFSFDDVDSYQAVEGDNITVEGEIDQFRGLTEIIPNSIVLNSQGNALTPPVSVTVLDESTESIPVILENVSLVTPGDWTTGAGGFGFIVFVENGNSDQFEVLIDSDSELYDAAAPTGSFNISGIGSQRSSSTSAPFNDGYRLQPCTNADITPVVGLEVPEWSEFIQIFPNPVSSYLDIRTVGVELDQIIISDILGRRLMTETSPETIHRFDTNNFPSGIYLITFQNSEGTYTEQFVKE